jgi:hypothetical protein
LPTALAARRARSSRAGPGWRLDRR